MPNEGAGTAAVPPPDDSTPARAVEGDHAAQPADVAAGAGPTVSVVGIGDSAGALEAKDAPAPPSADSRSHEPHAVVRQLEEELDAVKAALRDTIERYEGSTQELKVSNEELQAINEELRFATEELETRREELQSMNEGLTTVNSELKSKVEKQTAALNVANTALKAEIAERHKSDEARRTLFHRLVDIQEEERRRIARELHDLLGQHLTALDVGLKAGQQVRGCPREVMEHLEYLRKLTQTVDDEVDRLSYELRPRVLDDLGLADALKHHAEEWTRGSNVPVDLHLAQIETHRLPPIMEITLYRVIQEALTNVLKHAQAHAVSVIIERRGHEVLAIIEDDGRGFDHAMLEQAPETTSSVGLRGMEERVVMAGGRFSVESHVGSGTSLYIHLPVD